MAPTEMSIPEILTCPDCGREDSFPIAELNPDQQAEKLKEWAERARWWFDDKGTGYCPECSVIRMRPIITAQAKTLESMDVIVATHKKTIISQTGRIHRLQCRVQDLVSWLPPVPTQWPSLVRELKLNYQGHRTEKQLERTPMSAVLRFKEEGFAIILKTGDVIHVWRDHPLTLQEVKDIKATFEDVMYAMFPTPSELVSGYHCLDLTAAINGEEGGQPLPPVQSFVIRFDPSEMGDGFPDQAAKQVAEYYEANPPATIEEAAGLDDLPAPSLTGYEDPEPFPEKPFNIYHPPDFKFNEESIREFYDRATSHLPRPPWEEKVVAAMRELVERGGDITTMDMNIEGWDEGDEVIKFTMSMEPRKDLELEKALDGAYKEINNKLAASTGGPVAVGAEAAVKDAHAKVVSDCETFRCPRCLDVYLINHEGGRRTCETCNAEFSSSVAVMAWRGELVPPEGKLKDGPVNDAVPRMMDRLQEAVDWDANCTKHPDRPGVYHGINEHQCQECADEQHKEAQEEGLTPKDGELTKEWRARTGTPAPTEDGQSIDVVADSLEEALDKAMLLEASEEVLRRIASRYNVLISEGELTQEIREVAVDLIIKASQLDDEPDEDTVGCQEAHAAAEREGPPMEEDELPPIPPPKDEEDFDDDDDDDEDEPVLEDEEGVPAA